MSASNGLHEEIENIFSEKADFDVVSESQGQLFVKVNKESLGNAIAILNEKEFIMLSLFCEQGFEEHKKFTLFYVFEKPGFDKIFVMSVNLDAPAINSIGKIFPAAIWYEREISDGFGITFENSSDDRRLFLHEMYPKNFHPLLKSYQNGKLRINQKNHQFSEEYKFKEINGEGVYQIPVGPIHAGIIEPGHFRFSVIGEIIHNLEIRMFYMHRGIEKLAEGKKPQDALQIAESVSGDETVANATALCAAVENLSGQTIPKRAVFLRTLLLEMERIYSHLGDMAGMIVDVAYPVGASPFFVLREEILRKNQLLTGSRFMKGILTIGGLTQDIEKEKLDTLDSFLTEFKIKLDTALHTVSVSPSVIDRLDNTGILKHELIRPLNITGPAARASGSLRDTRQDYPYALYKDMKILLKTRNRGNVLSRFNVKAEEINESVKIIQSIIRLIPKGNIHKKLNVADGFIISLVEAARGQNLHYVHLKDGTIHRYKVRTASFCNWQAIEHAVLGNIVPDFPLINKSLNLSYAGTDL